MAQRIESGHSTMAITMTPISHARLQLCIPIYNHMPPGFVLSAGSGELQVWCAVCQGWTEDGQ